MVASAAPWRRFGWRGEHRARRYLRRRGYRCLACNWRGRGGELDLVMQDGATVVFVEVKTRAEEVFAAGEQVVNRRKQRHLIAAAREFIRRYDLSDQPCRFDVVVVAGRGWRRKIRHYVGAFRP